MIAFATLLVFSAAVMMLLLSPGPNMAFVMAHGVSYGLGGGAAAALGIGAADLVLTGLTATGITAVIAAWPPAFDLIRYAGAAYLLWMAYKALRRPRSPLGAVAQQASLKSVFLRSMLNSLLNPKALLFFMVFLPQFVEPGKGNVAGQLVILGCVLTAISVVFHALLGAAGGSARRFLSRNPRAATVQTYGLAVVLVLLALRLIAMPRAA
ncbi:LysE family translocator [Cupriavidus basilensis]|uniref:LysE family translocator n=1 Tax=Cupriavidus basilensis TaxID=68895 RepID=A0ABT6AVT9_9BURK|nr:LysE family translocator [Cupriavidus basilensis]MDF3836725.1 LysE family translocator [Cupriavidus basilensis]